MMSNFHPSFYHRQYATGVDQSDSPDGQQPDSLTTYNSAISSANDYNPTMLYPDRRECFEPLTPDKDDSVTAPATSGVAVGYAPYATPPEHPWEPTVPAFIESGQPYSVPHKPLSFSPSISSAAGYPLCDEISSCSEAGQNYQDALDTPSFPDQTTENSPVSVFHRGDFRLIQMSPRHQYNPSYQWTGTDYVYENNTSDLSRDVSLETSGDIPCDMDAANALSETIHGHGVMRHSPVRTTTLSNSAGSSTMEQSAIGNTADGDGAFTCIFAPYGCFKRVKNKNEWKRHIETKHRLFNVWVCDLCTPEKREGKDFNRKDLYRKHLIREHPRFKEKKTCRQSKGGPRKRAGDHDATEKHALNETITRCTVNLRPPPERSGCIFCPEIFHGPGSWKKRMEHIGQHIEEKKRNNEPPVLSNKWLHDDHIHKWLVEEKLIKKEGSGWIIIMKAD